MSNTSTSTKSVKQPPMSERKFPVPTAALTSQSVIWELWTRARGTLNPEELKWFSYSGEYAGSMSSNLRTVINGIAGLVSCDEQAGNFNNGEDLSILLWSIGQSLETIEAMHDVGYEADKLLIKMNGGGAA